MAITTEKKRFPKTRKGKIITEMLGWYGVFAYLVSYALVSFHALTVDSIIYQLMNFTGAVGLLIVCWPKRAYQPMVSNFAWASVALIILIKLIFTPNPVLF